MKACYIFCSSYINYFLKGQYSVLFVYRRDKLLFESTYSYLITSMEKNVICILLSNLQSMKHTIINQNKGPFYKKRKYKKVLISIFKTYLNINNCEIERKLLLYISIINHNEIPSLIS